MKLQYVLFEGTPEEFAQLPDNVRPRVSDLGEPSTNGATATVDTEPANKADEAGTSQEGDLAGEEDLAGFISARAPSALARDLVQRFADTALSWTPMQFLPGHADDPRAYFRLWRPGSGVGALAYVKPHLAKVDLRLPDEYAEGREHAKPLHRAPDNPYRITVALSSEAALSEAIELAAAALDIIEDR